MEKLSLSEIKDFWDNASNGKREMLLQSLKRDCRKGSAKIISQFNKKAEREKTAEREFYQLSKYERRLREKGFSLIAGVDESGRGALAGPIVAAAVMLPEDFFLLGIKDCKKLLPAKRKSMYDEIIKVAISWKTAVIGPATIDRIGIHKANIEVLTAAVRGLSMQPEFVLADGFSLPDSFKEPHLSLIKGDTVSLSIAAASIISKVTRDEIMKNYHKRYPLYSFDAHKGYGTREHFLHIGENGICPIHRRTFLG